MNANTFDGFTVPALKSMARDRGLTGYSRMRRAELIDLLIADDNKMKAEIMAEVHPRTVVRDGKVSPFDYPAVDGRTVTEAHSNICKANGHAYFTVDGVAQDMCPRCGENGAPVQPGLITGVKVGDVVMHNGHAAEVMSVDADCIHVANIASHVTWGALKGEFSTDVPAEIVDQFNRDCVALAYTSYATGNDSNRAARALARIRNWDADYTTVQSLRHEIELFSLNDVLKPLTESTPRVGFAEAANEGTEDGSKDVDFSEIVSAPQPLDIVSFLTSAHATLAALAQQAKQAENEAWDRGEWVAEEWTTVAKDLASAVANAEWSLNYRASQG